MYAVCVTVRVKPEHVENFMEATLANARATRREPGNVRFDVLEGVETPTEFFLYEVYKSEQDFRDHQQTDHYLRWRETVKDWMAEPRKGVHYRSRFPESTVPHWKAD